MNPYEPPDAEPPIDEPVLLPAAGMSGQGLVVIACYSVVLGATFGGVISVGTVWQSIAFVLGAALSLPAVWRLAKKC